MTPAGATRSNPEEASAHGQQLTHSAGTQPAVLPLASLSGLTLLSGAPGTPRAQAYPSVSEPLLRTCVLTPFLVLGVHR